TACVNVGGICEGEKNMVNRRINRRGPGSGGVGGGVQPADADAAIPDADARSNIDKLAVIPFPISKPYRRSKKYFDAVSVPFTPIVADCNPHDGRPCHWDYPRANTAANERRAANDADANDPGDKS